MQTPLGERYYSNHDAVGAAKFCEVALPILMRAGTASQRKGLRPTAMAAFRSHRAKRINAGSAAPPSAATQLKTGVHRKSSATFAPLLSLGRPE